LPFFVSHFPRRFFFFYVFKPITTMVYFRKTLQESGKVFAAMDCTSTGRLTDIRFVHENALGSILRNNESDSIETDERDPQQVKQEEPIISTVRGMTIDEREELKNAVDRIARMKTQRVHPDNYPAKRNRPP
jgi:hypothetical protein